MIEGLRAIRAEDSPAIIALIDAAYAEYPGCVMDLPGVDDDLPELADRWARAGGGGWVVERDGEVVACVGWAPSRHPVDFTLGPLVELKRLYVAASERGRGLGGQLVDLALEAARSHGANFVELWSDTRFHDAHRLYERKGFVRSAETRDLHDPSNTTEFHFLAEIS